MIELLRSQVATLTVLALALLAQLPHAAEVFMQAGGASGWWGWLHGLAYAIALELAVLLFVVQERRKESYGFAFVSVLVNLAYYAERVQLFSVQALPAWLISLALPIAIALYSHAIAEAGDVQVDVRKWWLQVRKLFDASAQPPEVEAVQVASRDGDNWVQAAVQLRKQGAKIADIASEVGKHESTVSRRLSEVMT